jgi:polyisoprenoid-binding protein YceI
MPRLYRTSSRALAVVAIATAFAAAPLTAIAQQRPTLDEFPVDAGHSIIEFSIPFAFARIKGRFTDSQGTILYDRTNPANSSVTVVIESKSIDTGWPHRDEHLRTSDFFDVEKYPKIVFQSERLRATPTGLIADGTLTLHGVTKNVSLPIQIVSGAPQRSKESGWLILNATSETKIARKDFGITGGSQYNSWFDAARAATMGDSVAISLEVEGYLPDAASERNSRVDATVARIRDSTVQRQIDRLRMVRDSAQHGRTLTGAEGPPFAAYFFGQDLTVRALIADGRIADAVALAGAMTSLFGTWRSHLLHGYALAVAGNEREAAAAFGRAKAAYTPPPPSNEKFKQVDEDWWEGNQIALGALELGQRKPASQVARALTEIYPTFSRAFVTLGRALAAEGDERGASEALATALRLDPYETRALEWSRRLRPSRE